MTSPTLTTAEAARVLKRSPRWVAAKCRAGGIRAMRYDDAGPWVVFADSVYAMLGLRAPKQEPAERLTPEDLRRVERIGASLKLRRRGAASDRQPERRLALERV